jgi:choline dehydrogenase-like flavoprotein
MVLTHAEDRFRILLVVWMILFLGGVIVMGVAAWLPIGKSFYRANPILALVWGNQVLLFTATLYLFSGIRDNELGAPVLTLCKLVSGAAMLLLLLSRSPSTGSAKSVIWIGVLDMVMGGLTLWLWLGARRSRALRLPPAVTAQPSAGDEPDNWAVRALRLSLALFAGVFGIIALAMLAAIFFSPAPKSAVYKIAAGNAVAIYATLACLCLLTAKSPRQRAYLRDVVVTASLFAALALIFFAIKFQLSWPMRALFLAGALLHLAVPGIALLFSIILAHIDRPKRFFGPWLYRVFERFAEVIIAGNPETVSAREITEAANTLLQEIPSRRIATLKAALIFIELGSLMRLRAPMSRLGRMEREHYLTRVFQSGRGLFRDLIKIKQLIFLIYYSDERTYREIGFVKFQDRELYKKAKEKNLLPAGEVVYPANAGGRELAADVCVIGSGAGGAVVAARLAEAGKKVVIVEEGPFLKRDRLNHDERAMQIKSYREGGLQLTVDYDMYILQGRCVGGSTLINNGVCFDLPNGVFKAWENFGAALNQAKLDQAFQRVRSEIQIIKLAERLHLIPKGSFKFYEGCEKLGMSPGWFEVNLDGCIGCGYCTSGCPYEKKMSVDRSYIPKALAAGAILVSECKAEKITASGARAKTVECTRADGSPLTINAKQIVVAGGAIGSSLLLLRSGIKRNVGTRLSFNVGSWVFAEFPEPIDAFDGIQMCAYHERPDYFLETIAMSPGAFAAAMPGWFRDHFDNMRRYRHYAIAGALIGSEPIGRIKLTPIPLLEDMLSPIDFNLTVGDLRKLRDGVQQVCRVFLAAGATRVVPATFQPLEFLHAAQLERLDELIVESDDLSFGSAHPQGGNPMSDDKSVGAVDSHFRVHGFDNLFVCDASVFPTSIKVNPQLTIMALADYAAGVIAEM